MKYKFFSLLAMLFVASNVYASNQRDGGSQILSPPYIQQQRELRYSDFVSKMIADSNLVLGEQDFQVKLATIFMNLGLRFEQGLISDPILLSVLEEIFPVGNAEKNVMSYIKQMRFATPEIVYEPSDIPLKDGVSYCYFDGTRYEEVSSVKEDWNSPICLSVHLATVDYLRTDEQWLAIIVNDVVEKFAGITDENGSEALQQYVLLDIDELLKFDFNRKFILRSIQSDKKEYDYRLSSQCNEKLVLALDIVSIGKTRKSFPYKLAWALEVWTASLDSYYYSSMDRESRHYFMLDEGNNHLELELEIDDRKTLDLMKPIIWTGPSSMRANISVTHCGETIFSKDNVKLDNPFFEDHGPLLATIHLGANSDYSYGENIFPRNSITQYFDFTRWLEDTAKK
ncbi:MAG: hypothetical protein VX642_00930 [Bdellovibrionota bacterium]|nr:hypothetical protein [Bdellovibrionota bacterium]